MKEEHIPLLIVLIVAGLVGYSLHEKYKDTAQLITLYQSRTPVLNMNFTASTSAETANWKTYTNAKYGYSIKYPSGWTYINQDGDFYNDEYFSDPNSPRGLNQRITVRVLKSVGPKWKNVKAYFDDLYTSSNSTEHLTINSLPAVKQKIEPKQGSEAYFGESFNVYKNNYVYVITNSSTDGNVVKKYDSIFDQVLATFKFTK